MHRYLTSLLVLALVCASLTAFSADGEKPEDKGPKVTLKAQDQAVVNVAAQISGQTGVQVAVTANTDAAVSVEFDGIPLDKAVAALADSFDGSWLRAYIIQQRPPDKPYTAEQFIQVLQQVREYWLASMTQEQRQALFEKWAAAWQAQGQQASPQDQPQPTAQQRQFQPMDDPVRRLTSPLRVEKISLQLKDRPLTDSILAFISASGYLVITQQGLQGQVTLELEDAPLSKALDQFAADAGATWRPFYLIAQPKQLTQQQIQQRMEEGFTRMAGRFWQSTPQERARLVERGVDMIQRIPQDRREQFKRFAPRILSWLGQYSAGLDRDRRMELKPLLKALGEAVK